MSVFLRFVYELLSIVATGITNIFNGFIKGISMIFSLKNYKHLITVYSNEFNVNQWVLVVITIIIFLLIIGLIVFIIMYIIKKNIRFRKTLVEQESLLEEIDNLNNEVTNLVKENQKILEIKSNISSDSPISYSSNSDNTNDVDKENSLDNEEIKDKRFPQLYRVDKENINTKIVNYNNSETLEKLLDDFVCFAASKLHLYYDKSLIRVFFGGLACGKMIILQGISGTGKTSLAYAWSKFNKLTPCVSSVQPSWRDRSDFFGYINDFTKKFNETDALVEIYSALYDDRIHTVILDEMNLARVEYYFAEVLSILEMPSRDEWLVGLVTEHDDNDPVKLINGKLKLGGNIWYIGTINNDDSTFMVTDKVYDRAMPIDINEKIEPFTCREQSAIDLNSVYLENLFKVACEEHPINNQNLDKIQKIDDYLIKHFRISFGNRIMKQLNIFVPVYVACGGDEIDGIDYFLAKKILRKFEQQNISYIRDEFDPFIKLLRDFFGKDKMYECISYVELLKKND